MKHIKPFELHEAHVNEGISAGQFLQGLVADMQKHLPKDRWTVTYEHGEITIANDFEEKLTLRIQEFESNEGTFRQPNIPIKGSVGEAEVNEGHSGECGPLDNVKTKDEALKVLNGWIATAKEEGGDLKKFTGVKWIGNTTEEKLDNMASKEEDRYIIAGIVDGEVWMARWSRD